MCDVAKLADPGLVTPAGSARSFVGTQGFVPPEGPGEPAADICSLGKVLYEMAMGQDRDDFPDLRSMETLPEEEKRMLMNVNEVILKACAPDPKERHVSAEALREEL